MRRGLIFAAVLLAGAASAQVPDDYVLGPLDQIEMNVANFPDLLTRTRIAPNGTVVLPLIGEVPVGGKTPAAAAAEIERRYRAGGFVNAPSVRLEITEYQSRKASVLGQVVTQGLIVLDRPYTVAELIARAGGLSPDAGDTANLVRQRPDGSGADTVAIDLAQIGGSGATTVARPGDVIFVPRAPTVSVVGAVNHPGVYRMTPGMTVQQALATAGDVARIGTKRGLKVRRTVAGATSVIPVSLDERLQAGDVLVIRERLF